MLPIVVAVLLAAVDFSADHNITLLANAGKSETSIAISGNRVLLAVIRHGAPSQIDVYLSNDRGSTWSAPVGMPAPSDGKTYNETDPTVAVFDDGSFGVGYLALTQTVGAQDEAVVLVRTPDGVNWSPPAVIQTGNTATTWADRPWLTVDPVRGTAYLSFTAVDAKAGNSMAYLTSTDRGAHWSAPIAPYAGDYVLPHVAAAADGTIAILAYDEVNQSIVAFASKGAQELGTPQTLLTGVIDDYTTSHTRTLSPQIPMVASFGNEIVTVFAAKDGIYFSRSTNSGVTFSQPLQLGGMTGDAVLPSVAIDTPTGAIIVSWLDGRDDPTGQSMRLYAARSNDLGVTFDAARPFSSPFAVAGRLGDTNDTIALARGVALTAFSTSDGHLAAARIEFDNALHHRAARH